MGGELYSDAIWSLCALPGCGPEVAQAILTEYGTLFEAVGALGGGIVATRPGERIHTKPADLKVNGRKLGAKRAARLHEAVTQKFN